MCSAWVWVLWTVLIVPFSAVAEVYRVIGEDGPVFTDKPSAEAEKIELDELQTISPPPVHRLEYPPEQKEAPYEKLAIVSPKKDQIFSGGTGDVAVEVSVQPTLKGADRLILYMDGTPQKATRAHVFNFTNMDRGEHTVRVDVVDKNKRALKRSSAITFIVIRPSRL